MDRAIYTARDRQLSESPRRYRRLAGHRRRTAAISLFLAGSVVAGPMGSVLGASAAPLPGGLLEVPGQLAAWNGLQVSARGAVTPHGRQPYYGSVLRRLDAPISSVEFYPGGSGYWVVGSNGSVFNRGRARFYGSLARTHLRSPVVAMAATPNGAGYWLATSAGRVYAFGDAPRLPSPLTVNSPVVGIVRTGNGHGYWLYEESGNVLRFGNARGLGPDRVVTGRLAFEGGSTAGFGLPADGQMVRWNDQASLVPVRLAATLTTQSAPVARASGGGSGHGSDGSPIGVNAVEASETPVGLPFSPQSFWNTPLPSDTSPAPDSASLVDDFIQQYQDAYGTVAINTTSYSSPVYTVPAGQPTVTVTPLNCLGYGTPAQLPDELSAVPIPPGATPAAGSDADMIIYQPATDSEWELWRAADNNGSWTACAGGKIQDVSSSDGVFPDPLGVAASGLSLLAGQIHLSDIASGSINHALEVQVPETAQGTVVAPADRTDGWSTASDAIPEGTRFRLDPDVDLASLGLSPAALEIATALQRYGMIVSDTSGAVSLIAQDPSPQMAAGAPNPYDAWFGTTPSYDVLNDVPWQDLEVISPSTP